MAESLSSLSRLSDLASTGGEVQRNFFTSCRMMSPHANEKGYSPEEVCLSSSQTFLCSSFEQDNRFLLL